MIKPIKPDVFLAWPKHCDYPLFRYNLGRFKDLFGQIYIAISNHFMTPDLENKIRGFLPDAVFVKPSAPSGDWRNSAISEMIKESKGRAILFLEQDFLIKDESFLMKAFSHQNPDEFVGYRETDRIHPAFALVRRDILYLTSKDFSAYPDQGMDHFGLFFKELVHLLRLKDVRDLGFEEGRDFYHMAGLTENYRCFQTNQPFYKPDEFLTYNHYIQKLQIPQSQEFMSLCEGIEKAYGNPDNSVIKSFFP